MSDEELAAAAEAPDRGRACAARRALARRGARVRAARARAGAVASSREARPTLERFAELRAGSGAARAEESRAILRELKAVGGDLRSLRLALTGAATGPELSAVLAALPRDEALARASRAATLSTIARCACTTA